MDVIEYKLATDTAGVFTISIVETPATDQLFVALSRELKLQKIDNDKQVLTGVALMPDLPMYRSKPTPHYMLLKAETVEAAAMDFMKRSDTGAISINHDGKKIEAHLFESWLVADPKTDKLTKLGLDAPAGAWAVSLKIEDPEVWKDVKERQLLNGFSIEGLFNQGERIETDVLLNKAIQMDLQEVNKTLTAKIEKLEAQIKNGGMNPEIVTALQKEVNDLKKWKEDRLAQEAEAEKVRLEKEKEEKEAREAQEAEEETALKVDLEAQEKKTIDAFNYIDGLTKKTR